MPAHQFVLSFGANSRMVASAAASMTIIASWSSLQALASRPSLSISGYIASQRRPSGAPPIDG